MSRYLCSCQLPTELSEYVYFFNQEIDFDDGKYIQITPKYDTSWDQHLLDIIGDKLPNYLNEDSECIFSYPDDVDIEKVMLNLGIEKIDIETYDVKINIPKIEFDEYSPKCAHGYSHHDVV